MTELGIEAGAVDVYCPHDNKVCPFKSRARNVIQLCEMFGGELFDPGHAGVKTNEMSILIAAVALEQGNCKGLVLDSDGDKTCGVNYEVNSALTMLMEDVPTVLIDPRSDSGSFEIDDSEISANDVGLDKNTEDS